MHILPTSISTATRSLFLGAAFAALAAASANATPETLTLDFTASGFQSAPVAGTATPPVNTVMGSVTLMNFDPDSANNAGATITLDSLNIPGIPAGTPLKLEYDFFSFPGIFSEGFLTFGTPLPPPSGGLGIVSNVPSFEAQILDPDPTGLSLGHTPPPPTLEFLSYSDPNLPPNSEGTDFVGAPNFSGTATSSAVTTATPEPGTLALFGAGLMSIAGFVALRRRKAA